jgi:DNA invertase Pin-like site-specific DNA recombinase
MTKPMERIAVYYRVSTDRQDFDSQKFEIERWIGALPIEKRPKVIVNFQDFARSGKDKNRPGFQEMLKAAAEGLIDTIVVYRLDRFSRDANTAIRTILELDDKGVAFISVTQPVLNLGHDNPFRRTMLSAFAEISQLERETTVARIKAGLEATKLKGTRLGRPRISKEREANVLRLRYLEGLSLRRITRRTGLARDTIYRVLREAALETSDVEKPAAEA